MASLRFRPLDVPDLDQAAVLYQEGLPWAPFTVLHIPHQTAVEALVAPDSSWHVLVTPEGKVVGLGGFERIKWIDGVAEPYIALAAEYRGNGVGESLMKAIMAVAFKALNLRRIQTVVLEDALSLPILKKMGFTHEGTFKGMRMRDGKAVDGLAYAMMKEVPCREQS